jgi:hypothetical protein
VSIQSDSLRHEFGFQILFELEFFNAAKLSGPWQMTWMIVKPSHSKGAWNIGSPRRGTREAGTEDHAAQKRRSRSVSIGIIPEAVGRSS